MVQTLAKYRINRQKIAEYFAHFGKVAKFRQIWSHWPQFRFQNLHLLSDEGQSGPFSKDCLSFNKNMAALALKVVQDNKYFVQRWAR